jgi:hypothetical protein
VNAWPVHEYLKTRFRNQRHYKKIRTKELALAKAQRRAKGKDSSSKLDSMDDNYRGRSAGKKRRVEKCDEEESGDESSRESGRESGKESSRESGEENSEEATDN